MAWNFACPDWVERLKAGRSLLPDLPLDDVEAQRAVDIFNKLRLPDVVGQPTLGEAGSDWLRDIVRAMFGSMVTGQRMVPEIFSMVPKKSVKTTGAAAITATALLMNRRPRAEMIFTAPTQEIADLAFQQTAGIIDADPEGYLQKRFHVQHHLKTIVDRRTKAFAKIKTFDMNVMTGSKPVLVIVDELHLMSKMSYAARVIGQIRGGLIANPEAVLIFITTQSDEPPAGAFKAELQYARGVRDGRISESRMLPLLYEFPEAMQKDPSKPWKDPANWPMVLPALNRPVTIDRLIAEYKAAAEKGEGEERRWASQHLNIEIGQALRADNWPGAEEWPTAVEPGLTVETLIKSCEVICAGLDGGGLDDLFSVALVGRERGTGRWLTLTKSWCHEKVLDRRKSEAATLLDFRKDGDLTIIDTLGEDIAAAVDLIKQVDDAGLLASVGMDPYGVGSIIDALAQAGIAGEGRVVAVSQGFKLMGAIKTAERKLADGTLVHADQPIMAWAVGNAKVEPKGNAILITKQASGTAKIDPLMALFDAVALMSMNPQAPAGGPSVYEDRGFLVL